MKQIVLAAAAALMIGTTAMAQDDNQPQRDGKRPDKTEMIQRRTNDVVQKYNLNEQQAAQLLELNKKYAEKLGPGRGMRGGQRGPRPGMGPRPGGDQQPQQGQRPQLTEEQRQQMQAERQQREADMKAYDAQLQQILTADQYKAYKADMDKHRPHPGGKGGHGQRKGKSNE